MSEFGVFQKNPQPGEPDIVPENVQLHYTTTISLKECTKRLYRLSIESPSAYEKAKHCIHENIVCTKNKIGQGSCNGDSGGPLAVEIDGIHQIIGISSWSIGCAQGYPDVYSNVFMHSEWIRSQIEPLD